MIEDKYELLTAMAKALDERDHLREENDVLERRMQGYKVATGSGEMPPLMFKVYEFGVKALLKKCFYLDWYSIGVKDSGGEPYPDSTVNEWVDQCYRSGETPKDFSMREVLEACEVELQKAYDRKWAREVEEWKKEQEGEDDEE